MQSAIQRREQNASHALAKNSLTTNTHKTQKNKVPTHNNYIVARFFFLFVGSFSCLYIRKRISLAVHGWRNKR